MFYVTSGANRFSLLNASRENCDKGNINEAEEKSYNQNKIDDIVLKITLLRTQGPIKNQ